jgi:hypothetical protein
MERKNQAGKDGKMASQGVGICRVATLKAFSYGKEWDSSEVRGSASERFRFA